MRGGLKASFGSFQMKASVDVAKRVEDDSSKHFPLTRGPGFGSVSPGNVFSCHVLGYNWSSNGSSAREFHFAAHDVQFLLRGHRGADSVLW